MRETGKLTSNGMQAVCFDLCGTLIDWNAAFEAAFGEAVGEWMGRWDANPEEKKAWKKQALRRYQARRKQGKGRIDSLRFALSALPIDTDERTLRHIAGQIRLLQPGRAKLAKGARETLEKLSGRCQIGIITNLDRERTAKIYNHLELSRYIPEEHLFCASRSLRKPSKHLFQQASLTMGIRPRRCVMVGNSYRQDIAGALAGGWQAVWIRPGAGRSSVRKQPNGKTVYIAPSVRALPKLLSVIASTRS